MPDTSKSGAARQSARSLATAYAEIDKLKESNERLFEELQLLGGFGTLINVLQNGLGEVVGELQPIRKLAAAATSTTTHGKRLGECAENRLRTIKKSLLREKSDTYDISLDEKDVGFLHDTPAGPYPCGPDYAPRSTDGGAS
jgi:hypothetical protein